jgi:hypothetical protein
MLESLLAQSAAESIGSAFVLLIYLAIVVVMVVGMWKVFEKANQPGWGAIIPVYNVILLLKVAGKPVWWIVLLIIPIVSAVIMILISIDISRNFGKGVGFGLGLAFLGPIFYPVLGLGAAEYNPAGISQR